MRFPRFFLHIFLPVIAFSSIGFIMIRHFLKMNNISPPTTISSEVKAPQDSIRFV